MEKPFCKVKKLGALLATILITLPLFIYAESGEEVYAIARTYCGAKSLQEYTRAARDFYTMKGEFQMKVDRTGVVRVYDPATNTFGAYNADGTTRTFFKPTSGQDYFNSQPGN